MERWAIRKCVVILEFDSVDVNKADNLLEQISELNSRVSMRNTVDNCLVY